MKDKNRSDVSTSEDPAQWYEELQLLYNTAPFGLALLDTDLRFIRLNQRLADIDGASIEDHLGHTVSEVLSEIAPKIEPLFRRVIETGEAVSGVEVRGTTRAHGGAERHYLVYFYPLTHASGKVRALSVVVLDITEIREVEDALRGTRELMRNFMDHSPSVMFVKDIDGRNLLVNRAFARVVNMEPEDLIGKTDYEIFPREVAEGYRKSDRQVLAAGEPIILEEWAPHEDGMHPHVEVKFPIFDREGKPYAVGGVATDIAQLRKAERALEERLRFEELISRMSTGLISLPVANIDDCIRDNFERIGTLLGIDRIALLEFSADGSELYLSVGYATQPQQSPSRFLVSAELPWFTRSLLAGRTLRIPRIDAMPSEAGPERHYCRAQGIRSFVTIPVKIGESVFGAISYSDMHHERDWPDELVQQFQMVSDIIASSLGRKRVEQELEKRLRFEEFVSDLSGRFVNLLPEDVDDQIAIGLKRVVEILEVERSTFFQYSASESTLISTHSHAVDGVQAVSQVQVNREFPWISERLYRGEVVAISFLSDLPEEAAVDRLSLEGIEVKSTLLIPINVAGSFSSVLTVGTVSSERRWPDDLIPRLQLIGEIFANALTRSQMDITLRKSHEDIKKLKDRLQAETDYLRDEITLSHSHDQIVGEGDAIKHVLQQVEQVALTDSSVLVLGETGVGKELVAYAIHSLSSRRNRVMVKVNCGALPATLIESELFGREKGAFTGALTQQIGRFELADGSTIFLDEIGDLSTEVQVKLLHVLQDGELQRLGSNTTIQTDVRVIAATHRDLEEAVEQGRFRADLYYRLNVFPITVPPLRERPEDIPKLVWHFVRHFSLLMGKKVEQIPKRDMDVLRAYSWPGNVRELANVVEYAMIICTGPKLRVELPKQAGRRQAQAVSLAEGERQHILDVLKRTGWRVRGRDGAAEILEIKPTTLESRMKKLGIKRA